MPDGFLAIWSDLEPAAETDYLHWFAREHAIERVSIPGFLGVRMFRALDPEIRRYFILYELESAGVVNSADYLARLNQPTPWSQRIMPLLGNFGRGGGWVASVSGKGHGGYVAPLRLAAEMMGQAERLTTAAVAQDRIAAARLLATDHARTAVETREKGLRPKDRSFEGLLIVEGLDAAAVRRAVAALAQQRPDLADAIRDIAIYETVFVLDKRAL